MSPGSSTPQLAGAAPAPPLQQLEQAAASHRHQLPTPSAVPGCPRPQQQPPASPAGSAATHPSQRLPSKRPQEPGCVDMSIGRRPGAWNPKDCILTVVGLTKQRGVSDGSSRTWPHCQLSWRQHIPRVCARPCSPAPPRWPFVTSPQCLSASPAAEAGDQGTGGGGDQQVRSAWRLPVACIPHSDKCFVASRPRGSGGTPPDLVHGCGCLARALPGPPLSRPSRGPRLAQPELHACRAPPCSPPTSKNRPQAVFPWLPALPADSVRPVHLGQPADFNFSPAEAVAT